MAGGRTPIKQLNALPLISAAQWTTGVVVSSGSVFIINGVVFKKFTPADTGINGTLSNVGDPRGPFPRVYAITNWLDFTGLKTIDLVLVSKVLGAGGDVTAQNWLVYSIPAATTAGGVVEPVPNPPGPSDDNMLGGYGNQCFPFVATLKSPLLRNVGPYPYFKLCQSSYQIGDTYNASLNFGAMGVQKLWMSCTTGQDPVQMFLTIWGQG